MNNMNNMMGFFQMLKGGGNPQEMMMNMLASQAQSNPILANLLNMAQNGDTQGIEQVARNMLASQGKDYDNEFNAFKKYLGL